MLPELQLLDPELHLEEEAGELIRLIHAERADEEDEGGDEEEALRSTPTSVPEPGTPATPDLGRPGPRPAPERSLINLRRSGTLLVYKLNTAILFKISYAHLAPPAHLALPVHLAPAHLAHLAHPAPPCPQP